MLKKLPIGIQTLSEIIKNNYLYIDKTSFVFKMAQQKYFFLSRPRRFGKSLFLDTIKQAFLGNKHLFEGLYLYDTWDWSQTYPVIHIDFGLNQKKPFSDYKDLEKKITMILTDNAQANGVSLRGVDSSEQFHHLIQDIYHKTGQNVVILIDEYDKPILDIISDIHIAQTIRDSLRGFYSCIKSNDAIVRFAFLTGVTKFSKVSLFSGLNNLEDITIDATYADCCGYTQTELENSFDAYLPGVDIPTLKHWYNGYNFGGSDTQKVYNPFDILLFFKKGKQFHPFWFETATPTFLISLLKQKNYAPSKLENITLSHTLLTSFDIDRIDLPVLMFQSGYLTIHAIIKRGIRSFYQLGFPNAEVKQSFYDHILYDMLGSESLSDTQTDIHAWLTSNPPSFEDLKTRLNSFFAAIPHDWHRNNPMGQYEGFYASIVYVLFSATGLTTFPEDTTSTGQMDMSIVLPDKILIIEFKCLKDTIRLTSDTPNPALQQIKSKNYAQKFQPLNKPIYAVGILFDTSTKTIRRLDWKLV